MKQFAMIVVPQFEKDFIKPVASKKHSMHTSEFRHHRSNSSRHNNQCCFQNKLPTNKQFSSTYFIFLILVNRKITIVQPVPNPKPSRKLSSCSLDILNFDNIGELYKWATCLLLGDGSSQPCSSIWLRITGKSPLCGRSKIEKRKPSRQISPCLLDILNCNNIGEMHKWATCLLLREGSPQSCSPIWLWITGKSPSCSQFNCINELLVFYLLFIVRQYGFQHRHLISNLNIWIKHSKAFNQIWHDLKLIKLLYNYTFE